MDNNNNKKQFTLIHFYIFVAILTTIFVIIVLVLRPGEKRNDSGTKEVRCCYCARVIVNSEGKIVHAHCENYAALQRSLYKCDYCDTPNVLEGAVPYY